MKIAFKNFLTTLKRYRIAALLNVAGLTLAFVAFYVIMVQVYSNMTFNHSIKDYERVYMLTAKLHDSWSEHAPNPVSYEVAEALPMVESIASMKSYESCSHIWLKSSEGGYEKMKMGVTDCNSSLLDVFAFNIVVGNADDFRQKNTAVVSESAARTMGLTVGDIICLEEGELKPGTQLVIAAIFEDFDDNTILGGRHVFRNDNRESGMDNSNWNYSVFLKMRNGASTDEYIALWHKKYMEYNEEWFARYEAATGNKVSDKDKENFNNLPVKLVPMDEFYFNTQYEEYSGGSYSTTITMLAIALVIVVVAFINFVNFFMALVPVRMRSVNICKVFGAGQWTLRFNFLFESVGLVLIAMLLALYLASMLDGGFISGYIDCSVALAENIPTIGIILAVALVMAITAALYPAFYITRFNASLAVRKGFASSKTGRVLRSGLLALQFMVSIALIILALVYSLQYSYMVRYDVGIERENLLVVTSEEVATKHELFVEKLSENSNISAVTSSNWEMFGVDGFNTRIINGEEIAMQITPVRYNAPEVLGIPVIIGNEFDKGSSGYLITDYTSQATGLGIGDRWDNEEIIGVIPHVNFLGADKAKQNTMLYYNPNVGYRRVFYVRLNKNVDVQAVFRDICSTVKEIEPAADNPDIEFVDDTIAKIYGDTKKQTVMISVFAFIAVIISLMGVFGIVMFETQHRRSEIAVRKVYGATSGGIVAMLCLRYLKMVVLCFVIAAPVAWLIADNWLQQFVNRIYISPWMLLSVFAVVTAVTLLLVTLRSLKAATENPADVVKSN